MVIAKNDLFWKASSKFAPPVERRDMKGKICSGKPMRCDIGRFFKSLSLF
jgi:hypothetical protein